MACELRTTPEFIACMTKQPSQTSFAAYMRGRHAPGHDAHSAIRDSGGVAQNDSGAF